LRVEHCASTSERAHLLLPPSRLSH
jgi:hypothetical protein